ncbi:MAG: 2OG-Fe(II) oxygenase [Candidatus Binatia bacterium]
MDIDLIVRQLRSCGFVVVEDALAPALRRRLDNGCADTVAFPFAAGGMGRGEDRTRDALVRGDVVSWLDDAKDADHSYLSVMEALRVAINEQLFLGLLDYEAHYAIYPTGARYERHLDALAGQRNRLLSTVVYLNGEWTAEDGGELVLYRASDESVLVRVLPRPGSMVLFLSEDFPHEVLAATKPRRSIAGWFRGRVVGGG